MYKNINEVMQQYDENTTQHKLLEYAYKSKDLVEVDEFKALEQVLEPLETIEYLDIDLNNYLYNIIANEDDAYFANEIDHRLFIDECELSMLDREACDE